MKKFLVIHKKQPGDANHPYSIVDEQTLITIPASIIHKKVEVPDKLYTKEELEALRNQHV